MTIRGKVVFIFAIVILTIFLCIFLTRKSDANKDCTRVQQQVDQIQAFFLKNKSLIEQLQESSQNADLENARFQEDGYIDLNSEKKVWIENIGNIVKVLFAEGNKTYDSFGIYYIKDDENSTSHLQIEIYCSENRMMHTILYSNKDLSSQDEWYTQLSDNWYLWSTGMT